MRKLIKAILFFSFLVIPPAMAGSGHDHGHGDSHETISSNTAMNKATSKVKQMADAGKIDASWATVTAASIEQVTYAQGPEWVISFKNDQLSDTSKQMLYLFL
ncbi:MAG: DUF6488 family protein [Candidatus Polarisedimenticolaceae bacterium]|nr:DUF6488 family protein [Candidatus Polarisedimenticolaceae bacterium]